MHLVQRNEPLNRLPNEVLDTITGHIKDVDIDSQFEYPLRTVRSRDPENSDFTNDSDSYTTYNSKDV